VPLKRWAVFVVADLLERGVPAAEIVAAGRQLERPKDLAERGVHPAGLAEAIASVICPSTSRARKELSHVES
jgi:NAD(P)H dehydrogenase (quinone)